MIPQVNQVVNRLLFQMERLAQGPGHAPLPGTAGSGNREHGAAAQELHEA